ncbi:MAG: polysaccharide biosynthesis protein [Flavobacteriales bacterium]|nr:polysaccharide biosynthesis protein [Flavobacteriales bacterium]
MNPLKKLAGQTAVYGLSSIVGRLLNYLLVPIYTYRFATGEYGVVTEMYSYVAILVVLLTYGMETAYFRFTKSENPEKVYGTSLISLFVSSVIFIFLVYLFKNEIAGLLKGNTSEQIPYETYILWFAFIISADAFTSIPFAYLREQGKALRFALLKLAGIGINIGLNLFFIVLCMDVYKHGETHSLFSFVNSIYSPNLGVGYIFIANLAASLFSLVLLFPELFSVKLVFEKAIWKKMMLYALPLLVMGLAGNINETLDRILLKYLLPGNISENLQQLGIYGACYKLSILMTIFIQAFRYAAEPFFFTHHKEKNAPEIYARVMLYFIIVCNLIFLGVMLNISWIQYFLGGAFREGLHVVPVLLMANLMLGVFFNLSIWYKLTDKTHYGAWLSIIGATLTVVLNVWWIPIWGYTGSAWATLICYSIMCVLSYFIGQKYFPIQYPVLKILLYLALSVILYFATSFISIDHNVVSVLLNNLFILLYLVLVWKIERPKKMVI